MPTTGKRSVFFSAASVFLAAALAAAPVASFAAVSADSAFNANVGSTLANGGGYFLAVQDDGKVLVGGSFTAFGGGSLARLARYNADGTADTSFNTNLGTGFTGGNVQSVRVLSSGKILVAGAFSSFNGAARGRMVLLNADGTEDATFAANLGTGFAGSGVLTTEEQPDGKILAGGSFTALNGTTRANLVRLNADGTEDAAFAASLPTLSSFVRDIEIQTATDKIVIFGDFTSFGTGATTRIARLNEDGTEDTAFAANTGTGFNSFVMRTGQDSSGNIYVGGNFTTYDGDAVGYVAKLSAEGVLDPTFAAGIGAGSNDDLLSVDVATSSDLVILGGNSSMATFAGETASRIARIDGDGAFDDVFGAAMGTGFNGQMQHAVTYGSAVFVTGTFTTFNGGAAPSARLMKFSETDTTAPTVAITTAASDPTSDPFTITITASEDVTGFDVSDLQATNATISAFTSTVPSTTWTALVTPTADGTVTVTVPAGSLEDLAANQNSVPEVFSIEYVAPVVPVADEEEGDSRPRRAHRRPWAVSSSSRQQPDRTEGGDAGYTPEACEPYLTGYVRLGGENDAEQVRRLETFLNEREGESLEVDGVYGQADFEAVKRFQAKNGEVLSFWNLSAPTGYVYVSTQKAVNRRYCEETKQLECPYFASYHSEGDVSPEVLRIKTFLNEVEGESLPLTEAFGAETKAAVQRFQAKYAAEVLAPWGLSAPTGDWYQSTRKRAEDILGCFAPVRLDNGAVLE